MTVIGKIRYYQGRVAYPSRSQLEAAKASWDLDFGENYHSLTEDIDCTHIQRIRVYGRNADEARDREERSLKKFFDHLQYRRGFRVLTHDTSSDSSNGRVSIVHEIVYVIESRPTRGYVKLTLKSDLPRVNKERAQSFGDQFRQIFDDMK